MGTVIPLIIILITLLIIQLEINPASRDVIEFGRGIIIFTIVLAVVSFFTTGTLNRLVSRSVGEPLGNLLQAVDRVRQGDYNAHIQVVSADELGRLGDAFNEMIRGLAERETLRTTFGKYVTPEIRDEILSGRIPMQGERREASVLFADLRNFTPLVESNIPEEVIDTMRQYFTAMHLAIRRHNGVVLQFVGDGIEAAFGVPVAFERHADAAVEAALEMRAALAELNQQRITKGRAELVHGVGIHSGPVLAGISGSREQSAYALIGTAVNLASRIQELNKKLGGDILISRDTVQLLRDSYELLEMPPMEVKGVSKQVYVSKVLSQG
jgi:class 3 adenylate cyclase